LKTFNSDSAMHASLRKTAAGLRAYLMMAVGMTIYSFGWIGCILPAHGVGGGGTGLSLLVSHALGTFWGIDVRIGTVVFILNAVLLAAAGFVVGWRFGVKTIYCIGVQSLVMNLMQKWLPAGDFLQLDNRLLLVILGGLLAGLGVAVCFRHGGSTGASGSS